MEILFVGGPGRSGTSFFAQQLVEHPNIVGFFDVELKIYCEMDGLIDLFLSFGKYFSPNRSEMAVRRLRFLFDALFRDASDQVSLGRYVDKSEVIALLDAMTSRLGFPNRLRRIDDEAFFRAAREFSNGLANLARRQPGKENATIFLEKTPHVLLHLPFLHRLHSDARCMHVMRDPRSVAHSLKRMPWGPSNLEDCISWVEGYWRAYVEARHWASINHFNVLDLYIEEIAADPEGVTKRVCREGGIPPVGNLFTWSDPARLNDWAKKADPAELAMLNERMGPLAEEIGYRIEEIGARR